MPVILAVAAEGHKRVKRPLLRGSSACSRTSPGLPARPRTLRRSVGGRLAQLVERLVYTEDVGSSSLSSPTRFLMRQDAAVRFGHGHTHRFTVASPLPCSAEAIED